jgi:hypothetical protein
MGSRRLFTASIASATRSRAGDTGSSSVETACKTVIACSRNRENAVRLSALILAFPSAFVGRVEDSQLDEKNTIDISTVLGGINVRHVSYHARPWQAKIGAGKPNRLKSQPRHTREIAAGE